MQAIRNRRLRRRAGPHLPLGLAGLATAVGALGLLACVSTDAPNRPDASHLLPDGMTLDAGPADAAPDSGPNSRCADGLDNDGDGLVDFPDDPGCQSVEDPDESNPPYCGLDEHGEMIPLRVLPPTGHLVQTTEHGASHYAGSCGGDGAPELIFELEVSEPTNGLVISTVSEEDPPITQIDTVLYVRRDHCADPGSEVACRAADPGEGGTEIALENPSAGTYYIFVDGASAGSAGQFLLRVRGLISLGSPCDPADQTVACAPGTICAAPQPGEPTVCLVPYCNDGLDNDGDGLVDFPEEPGCQSAQDHSEEDTCPNAGCPDCADGLDNDGDGLADWPADPGCRSAADPFELDECVAGLGFTLLPGSGMDTQTLSDSTPSRTEGSCSAWSGPEVVYPLHLPYGAGELEVSASSLGFTYLALYLRQGDCQDGTEIDCSFRYDMPETLWVAGLPPGEYFLFVDTEDLYGADTLDVAVTVRLPAGAPCTPGSALADCAPGGQCQNVGGSSYECVPTLCNNGVDDDGDGLVDFPEDPGCTDRGDTDEADSCAANPVACPDCWDGVDNDGDGLVDFPEDPGCGSAADHDEADTCVAGLPFTDITGTGQASASAPGGASAIQSTCGGGYYGEDVYWVRLPSPASSVTIQATSSVDSWGDPEIVTVLSARAGQCDAPAAELGCEVAPAFGDPNNVLLLSSVPEGNLFVIVDAKDVWNTSGTYDLSVRAMLTAGGTCIPAAQALECPAGTSCTDLGSGPICQ